MVRNCRECGALVMQGRKVKDFCDTNCRITWHNRRKKRGAEMYDLFMLLRYDRKNAAEKQVWSLLCNMAMNFKEDDQEAERQSHFNLDEACELTARYRAKKYRIG